MGKVVKSVNGRIQKGRNVDISREQGTIVSGTGAWCDAGIRGGVFIWGIV